MRVTAVFYFYFLFVTWIIPFYNISSQTINGKPNTRKFGAVKESTYTMLVELVQGAFTVPVRERTAEQRAAVRRFYRYGDRYSVAGHPPKLYLGE